MKRLVAKNRVRLRPKNVKRYSYDQEGSESDQSVEYTFSRSPSNTKKSIKSRLPLYRKRRSSKYDHLLDI